MVAFQALALILLAGAGCLATPARIVGGDPTTIEEYPSAVQVEFRGVFSGTWGQSCAASILNTYYVLSAAHCFAGGTYSAENRRIRAGATYRNTGGILVYVVREINHPTYGTLGNDGDITVVRLAEGLTYNPVIQQAAIIAPNVDLPGGLPVVHAGWGADSQGGPASPVLLDVTIYTVDNELCRDRYDPFIVTPNMICAGILDVGGKDACQGDSGGPLYYYDLDSKVNILVGVVSWGIGCAQAYYPGVSTAVSPYTNWIIETAV